MSKLAVWAGAVLLAGSTLWMTWPRPEPGQHSAPQLLMEAARNASASYQARQTSRVGQEEVQAEVMRRGNLARYAYATRPARIVLERPEGMYVYWPAVQEGWRILRRPTPDRPVTCAQLCATNYRWDADSGEGGTLTLTAYRRSDRRLARRFWVDVKHRVITRVECYDAGGDLAQSWALSDLKFREDIPLSLFDPPRAPRPSVDMEHPQRAASLDEAGSRAGFVPEIPSWLPEGYQLVEVWSETVQGVPAVRLVYSDGLETFSLLESPRSDRPGPGEGVARTRQLEIVKWSDDRLDYALLGSAANPAVLELAASLRGSSARGVLPIWERGWQRLGSLF